MQEPARFVGAVDSFRGTGMLRGVLGERLRRDRFFQLGVVLTGIVVLAALFAPWIAPYDPIAGDLPNAHLLGPGGRFLLGTDSQGRVFVVIGVVGWAGFVLAAQALGALDRRVLLRHLLPNLRTQVIISATLGITGAIMAEAALSFVGLGARPPTPSWGAMVADGRDLLRGDALREAYDPRLRNER